MSHPSSEYWSLEIPGLTEAQARTIQERLRAEFDVILCDPRDWMTRHFDESSVRQLAHSARAGLRAGNLSHVEEAGLQSLLEDCEEWLKQAR